MVQMSQPSEAGADANGAEFERIGGGFVES